LEIEIHNRIIKHKVMRSNLRTLFVLLALSFTFQTVKAQYPKWNDPNSLPIWMTPEEEARKHEIGQNFLKSAAVLGNVRNVAEFERMEGVLVRYPLGLPASLIAAFSQQTVVYTLVSSTSNENSARSAYQSAGANMNNILFIRANTDSYWTRDYGPWYIVDENNKVSIVDFPYNRPRPNDDAVPGILSTYFSVPMYSMSVVHTGGNYMTDGWGISASSDLVYEENSNNQTYVNQQMKDYLGIDTYHVTIDPLGGIKHIDCWGKFLDVDKILITSVPTSNSNYSKYEQVATYFAGQNSAYGTPYQVFRVYSPNGEPYTNSLILNDRVYVPIMNSTASTTDNAALAVYRQAMPGYTVTGIYYNSWISSDALHCRAMGLADRNMLYIKHLPLSGCHIYQPGFEINAEIVPLSGETLKTDSLFLIYKTDVRPYDTVSFVNVSGVIYSATLPVNPGETNVSYYLYAADNSGRRENHPFIGRSDAHTFTIKPSSPQSGTNKTICANQSIPALTVTVGSGETADWYSASSGGTLLRSGNTSYTPTAAGTYYAEARNTTTGCMSSTRTAVTLTVNANPSAPQSGINKTICANQSIPALTVTVGSGETADWYSASSGGTLLRSGNTSYTPTAAGTYYAEARNTTTGCMSSTRTAVTLTVNSLPIVYAGADKSIPNGTSTTISDATASGTVSLTYAWTPAASFVNATLLNPTTVNLTATSNYTLTVTDGNGCINNDQMTINVTVNNLASVSGMVFHDTNRMTDNTVNGTGTNAGGTLYANLLDATNLVAAAITVNSDGTYSFANVLSGTYTVQITINQGTAGASMPETKLPLNWINSGEHLGSGAGSDGAADGLLSVVVVGVTNVVQANFGIVKLPDISPTITVSPNVMTGITKFNIIVRVTELNSVNTDGLITVIIPRDSRLTFDGSYDPNLASLGGIPLNNSVWAYTSTDPNYHIFTTNTVITGGTYSTFGFKAQFNPGNTKGVYTITSQIISLSGGEILVNNNVDSEKLNYFAQ
jgi:agmatine deiminase